MRRFVLPFVVVAILCTTIAQAESPSFEYPLIAKYGGVVALADAAELPRAGAKIVFDIAVDSNSGDVNRGLESVARYLNLHAQAGHQPGDVKLALVLHGGATKCSLNDDAYAKQAGEKQNPNLAVLRELKKHHVQIFVCGQSLARNKYSPSDVVAECKIATSAMTVNVNRQLDGYAYLVIH